ncbi:MAG: hypothetical protein KKD74_08230 [Bacteroidetes bacterium]|nr:hypothetical protein [Bacteroidota bacterium]
MKPASLSLLKQTLPDVPKAALVEICLKLARYKKENKELLSYLLFDAENEAAYIRLVKDEISLQFADINRSQLYFVRKSIRKILRMTQKHIRYSGKTATEVELLLFFLSELSASGIDFRSVNSLNNMYRNQLQKAKKILATMHEDLQFDFSEEVSRLSKIISQSGK